MVNSGIRTPPQKTVESHKHIGSHIRINDLGPVGGHIVALKFGVDDVAVFLGIGTPSSQEF
jgi:hypothetical protein